MQSVTMVGAEMKKLVLIAVVLVVTGIGFFLVVQHFSTRSASASESRKAVLACELNSGSTRSQCECVVSHATAAGENAGKILQEVTAYKVSLLQDQTLVAASYSCVGS